MTVGARVARRLAAILAIDMVGFSRLMEADEDGTIARQRAHRRDHIEPVLRNHGGRIVKTTGDGMLVEFGSVVDAVDSAMRIHSQHPSDPRLQWRAGGPCNQARQETEITGRGVRARHIRLQQEYRVLGLGQTTDKLARYRRQWQDFLAKAKSSGPAAADGAARTTALSEQAAFGADPGNLRMLSYVPQNLREGAPLVVVLHGCTQTAGGYDFGTGWSDLAERHGFALLLPEQRRANNPNTCFTWFSAEDTTRGRGEALSIRQMIAHMEETHGVDRGRIYVTGLSAGGAMASVMLATYPEVFAGGAIVAGLPYGCAGNVQEAFDAMFQASPRPAREWGDLVRAASPHAGPWPKLSVWHGSADTTVKPANADAIVRQWADVHGVGAAPSHETIGRGHRRRVWHDAAGDAVIESYTIDGMAHGTPIGEGCGNAGAFILDVGISSTARIAEFWNLTAAQPFAAERTARRKPDAATGRPATAGRPAGTIVIDQDGRVLEEATADDGRTADEGARTPGIDPGSVITKALRAAGLMK